jgi:glutamate formiminotransferase / formiminotetrahydrofolate cyclodeaminase
VSQFECVPNFSEGRDAARVEAIVAPARAVPGVAVVDVEQNADHNRAVVTLVGDGEALLAAVFGMMEVATRTLDLTRHVGEHPRMGATDVVPFVPIGASTMDDAVQLATRLGERVGRELAIPVFLYARAARRPERADLAKVREGQFEGLRTLIGTDPGRAPDFGPDRNHPTAGAVAIGARPLLIAYNAYLTTPDVAVARRIAKAVRARDGGLPEVKALGFDIKERGRAQVSMNLTDYRVTPVHRALEAVRHEAQRYGVGVEESEVVGLLPNDALLDAAEYYLQLHAFHRDQILERKLPPAPSASGPAPDSLQVFSDRLAARTPTPGGGAGAAAAGALGTALGEMVVAYAMRPDQPDPGLVAAHGRLGVARARFLTAVVDDSAAYEALRSARRHRKEHAEDLAAGDAVREALRHASEVPLGVAMLATEVLRELAAVAGKSRPALASDLVTAQALLRAAREGALANVEANLKDLLAAGAPTGDLEAEVARQRAAA